MSANKAHIENRVDSTQPPRGSQCCHGIDISIDSLLEHPRYPSLFSTKMSYLKQLQTMQNTRSTRIHTLHLPIFPTRNAQTRSLAVLLVLSVQKTGEVGVRDEKQERPGDGLAGRTDHEVFVTMSGTFCFFLTNFEVKCYDGICTVYNNDIVWQNYQVMFILPWMVYMGRRILGCSVQMMYSTRMGMSSSSPHSMSSCPFSLKPATKGPGSGRKLTTHVQHLVILNEYI